ncbi:hypothetical protein Drose_04540 [Dactylosporangium roseum]|uniref:Uncharacterized protein n=1 Tax=Dactylosporangium roseum TaxID=47989 RepID=A0ABY5Z965_9ACTN|nr:hypothetical protein [Dactylosporangium roseum]UWZ37558.1 hypothetical protein Drose_04540 [Dactylosporangium roseum]
MSTAKHTYDRDALLQLLGADGGKGAKTKLSDEMWAVLDEVHTFERYVVLTNGVQYSRPIDYATALGMFSSLANTTRAVVRVVAHEDYKRQVAEAALVAL